MDSETKGAVAKLKESLASTERNERVLALEVRPKKYGFAVLEGPDALLDWGIRSYRKGQLVSTSEVDSLLQSYAPHSVVIRRRKHNSQRAANAARSVIAKIRIEAGQHSAETRFVSGRKIRRLFERYGCTNKHQIASLLAEWFDEIRWKLPTKRRPWQSERYNTLLFDALATGIAFFAHIIDGPTL